MVSLAARREGNVDDASIEFDQHIVATLRVILAPILGNNGKTTIECRCKVGEIVPVLPDVRVPLILVPAEQARLAIGQCTSSCTFLQAVARLNAPSAPGWSRSRGCGWSGRRRSSGAGGSGCRRP